MILYFLIFTDVDVTQLAALRANVTCFVNVAFNGTQRLVVRSAAVRSHWLHQLHLVCVNLWDASWLVNMVGPKTKQQVMLFPSLLAQLSQWPRCLYNRYVVAKSYTWFSKYRGCSEQWKRMVCMSVFRQTMYWCTTCCTVAELTMNG